MTNIPAQGPPTGQRLDRGAVADFRSGGHLALRRLSDGPVTRFLFADRADAYLTILYALLLKRRRHDLAPLHGDLYDSVKEAVEPGGEDGYSQTVFSADLSQLTEWGCLRKEVEVNRIRGYKDRRREIFRYELSADAVSFLEWLEGRMHERLHGKIQDGRDLLEDLVGRLNETASLVKKVRDTDLDEEIARRLMYLLAAADQGMDQVTHDLIALRAEMHRYARGRADAAELKVVLERLESYAKRYARRMRELGTRAYKSAIRLARPSSRAVLRRSLELAAGEGSLLRRALPDPDAILDAAIPYLSPRGGLLSACAGVEDMACDVVARVHRYLRDIELRNVRLEDLRARIGQLACLDDDDRRPRAFLRRLMAFAHFSNDPNIDADGGKAAPPLPRRFGDWSPRGEPAALRRPTGTPEAVFRAAEERRSGLRDYVWMALLGGRREGLLSQAALRPSDDPLGWFEVAKACYLAGGREMRRCGFMATEIGGRAALSRGLVHLETSDHRLDVDAAPTPPPGEEHDGR